MSAVITALILVSIFVVAAPGAVTADDGNGWLSGWQYRRPVTINNTAPEFVGDGLVSYWSFDDGTARDVVGTNDGTIYGASSVDGRVGKALSFDGIDDYVNVGNDSSLRLTDNFTVELWAKRDVSQSRGLINKFHTWPPSWDYEGWSVISGSDNRFGILLGPGGHNWTYLWTTDPYSLDWHHVVFVRDSGVSKIYVDGEMASGTTSTNIVESNRDAHIGDWYAQYNSGSQGFFDGLLDEARIYNQALSPGEIRQNYYAGTPPPSLTNYQVKVDITHDFGMQPDFDDLRFTSENGTTQLSYWIENYVASTSAKVWVKVPSIPENGTTIIYMYYGNPSATDASDIKDTFVVGDDFNDGSLDTELWTEGHFNPNDTSGTVSVAESGGIVTISVKDDDTGTSVEYGIEAPINLDKFILKFRSRTPNWGGTGSSGWRRNTHGFVVAHSGNIYFLAGEEGLRGGQADGTNYERTEDSSSTYNPENYHLYTIIFDGSKSEFYVDEENVGSLSTYLPTTPFENVCFSSAQWSPSYPTSVLEVDWVYVAKYTSPEPTIVIDQPKVVARGNDTAVNVDLDDTPPWVWYAENSFPPIMAERRIGAGAVVASGAAPTCRNGRWTTGEWEELLDVAFQWMKPGAENVLWYEGYGVYNDTYQSSDLVDELEYIGYTVTGDSPEPITADELEPYDILVIPQLELGPPGTGGNPNLLPDADVEAIVSFVEAGGGLLIMEGSDFHGHNYYRVQNKILEALGMGVYFQSDQVQDSAAQPVYWFEAVVDNETEIGAAYQAATGLTTVEVYSVSSLTNKAPPPTLIIAPSDDAAVYESDPDTPEIRTDRIGIRTWDNSHDNVTDYRNVRSFVKFDLSGIPEGATITGAKLVLYNYYAGYTISGVTDVEVIAVDNDNWAENTMTWNTQPQPSGYVIDSWEAPTDTYPAVWASWTVTDFVAGEFGGDETASLRLRASEESYDNQWRNVYFRSKDYFNSYYHPYLEVTYTPA